MKKFFIIFQFIIVSSFIFILSLNNNFLSSSLLPTEIVSAAASQTDFQNSSPWFVTWWNKVSTQAQNVIQWFQQKAQNVLSNGQQNTSQTQNSLSQYPSISGQNSINNQSAFPIQQSGGSSGGGGGGDENGSQGSPYKLEPNQFKKMCGQNTYVLYWRKGGKNGRDMAQPAGGAGAGKDQGAKDYWQLPTCEELAECHCCCNTCVTPESECKAPGWVFNAKGCPPNCKPNCEGDCKPKCEMWSAPKGPGDSSLNRDCKCSMEGCPVSNAKDCKIMIVDPGQTQVDYTKKDGQPEQYFKGTGIAYFKNGNGPNDPKSKIIAEPNDKAEPGYVKKLKNEKGKCCKCYQDGPPIQ